MNVKQRAQQGFTLIELMIVVAIIGILAAVAIPQYKDYTAKAKLGNAITAADPWKTAIALCAQESGDATFAACGKTVNGVPDDVTSNGGKLAAEVASITSAAGVITVKMAAASVVGTDLGGMSLTFTPTASTNAVTWKAGSTDITNTTLLNALTKNNN
jgi:type IV pilus assembly protein PilA